MSDGFDWEESDNKYTEYESTNELTMDAIYSVNCPECNEDIRNCSFDPDADSPSWAYECHDCGIRVRVKPAKLTAYASDVDI